MWRNWQTPWLRSQGDYSRVGSNPTIRTQNMQKSSRRKFVRIIPLGGLGEVGRNMMLMEYGNAILIIDMGLRMPEEDMPGVDYIIPNISYLKGKEKILPELFLLTAITIISVPLLILLEKSGDQNWKFLPLP